MVPLVRAHVIVLVVVASWWAVVVVPLVPPSNTELVRRSSLAPSSLLFVCPRIQIPEAGDNRLR
jgi:hypothetical protein